MDIKELRSKELAELQFDMKNLEKELFDLRFKANSEDVTNSARIGQIRRHIARIHTIVRERELDQNKQENK